MKIVIDIPEEIYKSVKTDMWCGSPTVGQAILNGTPLPKGYGNLIDVDDLIKRAKKYTDIPNIYISRRNKDFIYFLEREEVIIPADKAESEE